MECSPCGVDVTCRPDARYVRRGIGQRLRIPRGPVEAWISKREFRLYLTIGGTYVTSMEEAINFEDDVLGTLLKSVVFGALVGMIATYRGYISEPTSAGVSAATTGTVVIASVAILISDYVITALWGV